LRAKTSLNVTKVYFNLVKQCWYNQGIMISKWLETLIKVSKRSAKKERKLIAVILSKKQC